MIKKKTGIILALDIEDENSALRVVRATSEHLDAIKIGIPLIINTGLPIIHRIKEYCQLPLIADLKIMDVPHIARKILSSALNEGCDIVTISGQCGPTVIKDCLEFAHSMGKEIIIFTEFTHSDGLIDSNTANRVAYLSRELKVYGIQAPGTKPERVSQLRDIVGPDLVIVSCGIGAQGPAVGSALKAGADFEIIGRKICDADNPNLMIIDILATIADFLPRNTPRY